MYKNLIKTTTLFLILIIFNKSWLNEVALNFKN